MDYYECEQMIGFCMHRYIKISKMLYLSIFNEGFLLAIVCCLVK